MKKEKRSFAPMGRKDRKKLIKHMCKNTTKLRIKQLEKDTYRYESFVSDLLFRCDMTDKELEISAGIAVDIMEELKSINNSGMDKARFGEVEEMCEGDETGDFMKIVLMWEKIKTEKLLDLIASAMDTRKVVTVFDHMFAKPVIQNAVIATYSVIVDRFDERKSYVDGAFFLLRAIMLMGSRDVEKKK